MVIIDTVETDEDTTTEIEQTTEEITEEITEDIKEEIRTITAIVIETETIKKIVMETDRKVTEKEGGIMINIVTIKREIIEITEITGRVITRVMKVKRIIRRRNLTKTGIIKTIEMKIEIVMAKTQKNNKLKEVTIQVILTTIDDEPNKLDQLDV